MARKKSEPVYLTAGISDTLDRISRRNNIPLEKLKLLNPDIKGPAYFCTMGRRIRIK